MKLITNKSKNLLYCISVEYNVTVQFGTSYAVATQRTADSSSVNTFKIQGWDGTKYTGLAGTNIAIGKLTTTFTTPSTTGFKLIRFGLNGVSIDTLCRCDMDLKPSTTYTFTCNFTNITQGSVSWKDMMLVEGSTAVEYEPYSYNLLNKWHYVNSFTAYGNIYTNNGDGSWYINSLNGTANSYNIIGEEFPVTAGHKVLLRATYPFEGGQDFNGGYFYCTGQDSFEINTGTGIYPIPDGVISLTPRIFVNLANRVDEKLYTPQVYDLTLMYGAGNEPTTVEQFYIDYPELKVSPLGFIGLKNLDISNKNIKRLKYATTTRNLFDLSLLTDYRSIGGGYNAKDLQVKPNTTYTISTTNSNYYSDIVGTKCYAKILNSDGSNEVFIGHQTLPTISIYPGHPTTFTTDSTGKMKIAFNNIPSSEDTYKQFYEDWFANMQIEEGSTATSYVPYGYLDLGIMPSNSGYILDKYNNLSEELLEENIEKDTVNYHIPDKTNILLNKIEGKTNKIVQLLDKSTVNCSSVNDWIGGTGSDTNLRVANGVVSIDGTLGSYSGVRTQDNKPIIKGHKYYISTWAMCSKNASNVLLPYTYGFSSSTSTLTANEWKNAEKIDTANVSDTTSIGVRYGSGESSEETVVWSVKKPQFFDLTSMYGFGNEPTTVEQFKKDYPQFFDEKLDGIWNVKTSGISTTGKNLFDMPNMNNYYVANGSLVEKSNEYIICKGDPGVEPGQSNYSSGWFEVTRDYGTYLKAGTYTISADWTCLENEYEIKQVSMFIDINKSSIRTQFADKSFYTGNAVGKTNHFSLTKYFPEDYYQIIFTLNSGKVKIENIQIELNSTATTYEPYVMDKIDLLSTQTLNGINGVNDYIEVIDKGNGLYDLKKTQNIDSVDLGSLGFDVDGSNFVSGAMSSYIKPPANDNSVGNYICQKYVNCALNKSFVNGDFGVNSSGYVYFRNSAYTTANDFNAAVTGTMFYYQLKTPVVTTIATNLTYNQVSALRTNGGLLLVNDNNNQKYVQPDVTLKENFQYKNG